MRHIPVNRLWQISTSLILVGCFCCGFHSAIEPSNEINAESNQAPGQELSIELERLSVEHLPNAIRIHPKVISGGLPEDAAAFEELKQLGIKTIISVDGAQPNVELAKQFGMEYIHLPHGYNGVSEIRSQELAKAVLEKNGPIYIHCHHGKHRSPTAAAVACVGAGFIPDTAARAVLKFANTSPTYQGLYQSADLAKSYEARQLHELTVEYRERAEVPPLAQSMVDLDHVFARIAEAKQAGWEQALKLPNMTLPHDALLMREHFSEMLRTDEVQRQSIAFRELTRASEHAAKEINELLDAYVASQAVDHAARFNRLSLAFSRVEQNCKNCHQKFRDTPLVR